MHRGFSCGSLGLGLPGVSSLWTVPLDSSSALAGSGGVMSYSGSFIHSLALLLP